MPAPLAKGLIIAASVLVAAGIALYESPQVRQWMDESRRKIAVALHSFGDDEPSPDRESRRRRREELLRQAREEGIAVDLDELAKLTREEMQTAKRRAGYGQSNSSDETIGNGSIRTRNARTTGRDSAAASVRQRGDAGLASGSGPAPAFSAASPFSNNQAALHSGDEDEAPSPEPFTYIEPGARVSSVTIKCGSLSPPAAPEPLIDLNNDTDAVHSQSENKGLGSLIDLETSDADQATQSFYSLASSDSRAENAAAVHHFFDDHEAECISTGTLTPSSERSVATGASTIDSYVDGITILSMQNSVHNESDQDARSEIFSEGGFTDAGFSEAGFSDVGNLERPQRFGVMTPSSWTDVGSDDDSEWGGAAGHGHVHQMH